MEEFKMKTTRILSATTILIFLFSILSASATEINVRLQNHKVFKFVIDNVVYNNSSNYLVRNIHNGYHMVSAYERKNGNNGNRLIFSGNVFVPGNKKLDVIISKNAGFKVIRETSIGGNNGGGNHGNDNQGENHYGDNNDGHNDHGNNNNNGYNSEVAMGDYEFGMLLSTVRNTSFDSSKMDIAKTALIDNRVYARQVLELVRLYSFDSSKLEIAKYAYSRTVDKGNYFLVNSAFTFSSTSDDLNRFIRNGGF
jgi:hypothetical protein